MPTHVSNVTSVSVVTVSSFSRPTVIVVDSLRNELHNPDSRLVVCLVNVCTGTCSSSSSSNSSTSLLDVVKAGRVHLGLCRVTGNTV